MLVKRIHKRGATVTVEAHGEVLFAAVGPVGRWTNRFSNRVTAFTSAAAPSNKRPRWAHYGEPLKSTITSSTSYQPARLRVYSAVGSSAPYAAYVDQGTGVFGGGGPYPAKILPPWQPGSPSLYEATWRPGGPGGRLVSPVMIKGQRGQKFFAEGLAAGFRSMRMRSAQLPGEGGPKIAAATRTAPPSLLGRVLGPKASPAFIGQLALWRQWRDEAWADPKQGLGRGGGVGSRAHIVATNHAHIRPPRPPKQAGPTRAQIAAQYHKAIQKEREDLQAQASAQYTGRKVKVSARRKHNGVYAYEITVTLRNGALHTIWIPSDYQVAL